MATAFDMTFDQWPPASPPVRHGVTAPVGAIRLATSGKSQHREIKVRIDGAPSRRWMNLARFWWLKNKGPVPAGMRVAHFDGDTLNDVPANYALFTPGDVIASHHLDNPAWSRKQHKRCAAATAQANRDRAEIDRARRWLPDRWYAVDLDRQTIVNVPHRERWQVYAARGISIGSRSNGRGYEASVLGWPDLPKVASAALAVLAGGERTGLALWNGVKALLQRHGWTSPAAKRSMAQYLSPLFDRRWIVSRRGIGRRRCYVISPAALVARGPWLDVVARRGDQLAADEYRLFARVAGDEGSGVAA